MINKLQKHRLVPVISLESSEMANPLADALLEGGLPCAEVTLRTEAALDSIKILGKRDDLLLGAGTVHSRDQAKAAVDAGARFLISPGINPLTVEWCIENKIPIFPGVANPTDLELAMELGLDTVKFFPAELSGGAKYVKALADPYNTIRFIPTGGISTANLHEYLNLPNVIACGGSWMVKKDLLKAGDYDAVTRLTAEAVSLAASLA